MVRKLFSLLARAVVYIVLVGITAVATIAVYNKRLVGILHAPIACEWNDKVGTAVCDLRYADGDFGCYDLYLPADRKAHSLVLFIHGGGFTGGDKADKADWCRFFTSKGYITASVNYTLADGKHRSDINKMYGELLRAVAAVKAECASRGYHVDGMATSGESAGGCLAMLYAYRSVGQSPVPVKFVFQQTGPASFDPDGWGSSDDEARKNFVTMMTGKTVTHEMMRSGKYHDLVAEISPEAYVEPGTVPTICAYGPKDKVVPVALKLGLLKKLKRCGVPHCYIEYPHSGHALLDDPDKQQLFVSKALEYCKRYF